MFLTRFKQGVQFTLYSLAVAVLLCASAVPPGDQTERARSFTRNIEFDYVSWTLDALWIKIGHAALGAEDYIHPEHQSRTVINYINLVARIQQAEANLTTVYANPDVEDPAVESIKLKEELDGLYSYRQNLAPLAEAVLQDQVAQIVAEQGLTFAGQPLPPILYHTTPLPVALIISPRDAIRQDADISLVPDLTVDQWTGLEQQVDDSLNVSSLVVRIGGVGLYPTMVMQTSDLNWLAEVVAHEWTHNFLTLRPLGVNYMTDPELRTMNETAASIAGKEIGRAVIERYYPELLPAPQPEAAESTPPPTQPEEPAPFDFRAEMHQTRVTVDNLLAEKKIAEAEHYMEARRIFFWENGYLIRKLNQAYFAFHGAYADEPVSAAGADPVGAAVRAYREKSPSLEVFLKHIAWMSSFAELQAAVAENP